MPLFQLSNRKSYGGIVKAKRKITRPLDKKRLHHVILKSRHATGAMSFKNNKHQIVLKDLIFSKAKRYGVRIAKLSNVGNHFHLLLRFQDRELVKTFFKVIAGMIARIITGAQRGNKFGKFWDGIVFSRVVSTGLDEVRMFDYLDANCVEALFGRKARMHFEKNSKAFWNTRTKS